MKRLPLILCLITQSACELTLDDLPACEPGPAGAIAAGHLAVLDIAADYSASSVDLVQRDDLHELAPNRAIAGGDAALRRVFDRVVLIGRGTAGTLQLLEGAAEPRAQVALGDCNPHDVAELEGGLVLVSCYDDDTMRIVDLCAGEVRRGPSLAELADADGLPEMDQLIRVGARVYVSLQRLDRAAYYSPTGPGLLVAIDAATHEVLDLDAAPGLQGHTLPCTNPYSDLELGPDGLVYVGCSGDFMTPTDAVVARVDPQSGAGEVVADALDLGGFPTGGLRVDADGAVYVLIAAPDAFTVDEMRLVRLTSGAPDILYASPGFTLSGLAVDGGLVYVGDRSPDSTAGLWAIDAAGRSGPYTTSLPPYEIEAF